MTKKVMKLVNPHSDTGLMQCKICGDEHTANIRPGSNGKFFRGSWQCRHSCKLDEGIEK